MNEIVKELAQKAGFNYDCTDSNFYSPESSQWINREIHALVEAVVDEIIADHLYVFDSITPQQLQEYLERKFK